MIYAQFYHRGDDGTFYEGVGDRQVVILDGRPSPTTHGEIAEKEARKRGYDAWRIFKGESFTRSRPISQLWPVRPVDATPPSIYDNY